MKRKETGALGEKLAADFLKKKGYKIVGRNYRCAEGEIDIIARQKDCICFVEVRTKTGSSFGTPEESITPAKMGRMRAAAQRYRQENEGLPANWRIDFVAVVLGAGGKVSRIELIENAVGE